MSEIPFNFYSPIPKYFRDKGLFKDPKNLAFVSWCFEKCSHLVHTIFHDNQRITLQPYQFIFGRLNCAEETGLTENEVRTQQLRWEKSGFLKKATNKTPNRFTIYEWVLTEFSRINHQQNHQQTTNKPPTNHHNLEDKKNRSKESLHPYPSSKKLTTDDFSSKIEIIKDVFISQDELAECIKIKGSREAVEHAIQYIKSSKSRTYNIKSWSNALATWDIKANSKDVFLKNQSYATMLENHFSKFNAKNWRCYIYHDKMKDIKGIVFDSDSPYVEPISVSFNDKDFGEKVDKLLIEKGMRK